jgi:hypothetical protein
MLLWHPYDPYIAYVIKLDGSHSYEIFGRYLIRYILSFLGAQTHSVAVSYIVLLLKMSIVQHCSHKWQLKKGQLDKYR